MKHTGMLFLSKTRPEVGLGQAGEFQLTLQLIDNLGERQRESYRVRWSGPDAAAFWAEHRQHLLPGAALHAELERLHLHYSGARSLPPELHARVTRLQVMGAPAECF